MRLQMARLIGHPWFENFLLLLIFLSSITLALDTPGLDSASKLKHALEVRVVSSDCCRRYQEGGLEMDPVSCVSSA
jgi:hypothetical protein